MDNMLSKCRDIVRNIEEEGMLRYDPRDIRYLSFMTREGYHYLVLRKLILGIELFNPMYMRKLFRIKKSLNPTSFYHVGMAYLLAEKHGFNLGNNKSSWELCQECIKAYVYRERGECYWDYDYSRQFFYDPTKEKKRFTMHVHGLARLNSLLLRVGIQQNNNDFIEIACDSLWTTLKQHTLTEYSDGSMSISYYCNSDDVTLNVCAEFALWISLIPPKKRTKKMNVIMNGILKLMINEQQQDGSWYYFGSMHHAQWGGKQSIDCHHSAYNLAALLSILNNSDTIEPEIKEQLITACDLGMSFFVNNFFDFNGNGIELIGAKRPACSVQYSEAVIAFCEYLSSIYMTNYNLKSRVRDLLTKTVIRLCELVEDDGTAPSGIYFGRTYNLRSIRWGSGPILQAIVTYLAYTKERESKLKNDK